MDWLTFIAEMTKSLAWPVVVGFAVWHGREEVRGLFATLRSAKWGDASLDFEREVRQAELVVNALPGDSLALPPVDQPPVEPVVKPTLEEALDQPRLVILESWEKVQTALLAHAKARGLIDDSTVLARTLAWQRLMEPGAMPQSVQNFLRRLRTIRDMAERDPSLTVGPDDVEAYAAMASLAINAMNSKPRQKGAVPDAVNEA